MRPYDMSVMVSCEFPEYKYQWKEKQFCDRLKLTTSDWIVAWNAFEIQFKVTIDFVVCNMDLWKALQKVC